MKISFINASRKVLLFFICSSFVLFAQKPNYKFNSIKKSDGLINTSVYTIYEDSFGFIWLATQHGIQKYDGITFTNFIYSENDSTGLWHNFVYSLFEDHEKNIWIATQAGINKYIRKTNKIERIPLNDNIIAMNRGPAVYKLIQDNIEKDILWIVGYGLIKLNTVSDSTTFYKSKSSTFAHFTTLEQHPLEKDKLLIGSNKLYSFDKKSEIFDELLDLKQESEIPNNLVNAFAVDPANNELLWLATGDLWGRGKRGGLIKINLNNKRSTIFNTENRPNEIPDKHMLSLCFEDKDHLWIGTRNKGTILYNKKEDKFYNYRNNNLDSESFVTSTAVLVISKDRSGTLWFGTWGQGISVLSPGTQKFTHYKHVPNSNNGLLDNNINTFAEDKNGEIWIGTFKGGLSRFNPRTRSFTHYFSEFISDENNSVEITHLLFDSRDNLWIGTYKNALYRYNPETGIKRHFEMGTSNKNVSQTRITAVSEIEPGEILVSTYGGGLNVYNYETDSFKHYLNDPNDSTSIPDNQIWFPFKGPDNNYYFSGNATSLFFKFEPKIEKFSTVSTSRELSTFILPVKNPNGNYYINDVANGMRELIFGNNIEVNSIVDADGKQMYYESLLIDTENRLWLGTDEGLIEFDPQIGISKHYDIDDGIQGYEYHRYSALKASTGEMYFGGANGFNVFYPDEITASNFKPKIVFTDFKLFQKSIAIGSGSVLKKSLDLLDGLELNYDQNDFTISFAALDLSNPPKINYKYILENHDEKWIDAGHKNYASYTNMDPGEYTFKVLATNSDGIWLQEPKTLSLIISPPYWETASAYIVYGLIFILGVFGVDRFQRKRILVKEKTASKIREAELRAQLAESENERKSKELEDARNLQLSMLPKELPALPNFDIAVYINTATEVGGDYYDFHVHLDGTLTVIIGDATGHGMQSGMMVSIIKSLFMSDRSNKELVPFFKNTNKSIKDMQLGRLLMALASIQFNKDSIKLVIAGMPPVYHFKNNSKTVDEIATSNFPLGALTNSEFDLVERNIEKGDTFLLMSDGFPELRNMEDEMIGYKRTRNLFEDVAEKTPDEIIMHFKENGNKWMGNNVADDDVTFVVIKVK